LKPGMTLAQAQADANQIAATLAAEHPLANARMKILVEPLTEKALGPVRPALELMLAAVGLVLLIACANVANLALARAASRQKEIAIRLALGARRSRIARQFLSESILLSLCGGALGLILAQWGIQTLRAILQPDIGSGAHLLRWNQIALDWSVLLFTLGLALATGILSGLAPAFSGSRGVSATLKEGGRGLSAGGGAARFRKTMVAAEIAISLVLLIGSGLLMRSFVKLQAVNPGFDTHNVLTMTISVAGRADYIGQSRENLYRSVIERAESVPGVLQASMTNHLPIAGDWWSQGVNVEGRPDPAPGEGISTIFRVTRPGYFSVMRVAFISGRDFNDHDSQTAPPVAIINEKLAARLFPGESPLGKRIVLDGPRTVIGVIKNMKQNSWGDPPANEVHLPFLQNRPFLNGPNPWTSVMTLVVKTGPDAEALAGSVKRAVWSVDRALPVSEVQTLDHAVGNATWSARFSLMLVGLFSALALLLAIIGVYGVMAYEVTQRTHEIGIRMALGAGSRGVVALIARQSVPVAIVGIVIGLAAAAALVRLMKTMLYQVDALDPATFAAVALLMLVVAIAAALVPARRAIRVDPMIALRND
jgi:putative ABC transport system permease protein